MNPNNNDIEHGDEVPLKNFQPDFNKILVIIRGISGAGKSTLADYLKYIHTFGNPSSTVEICEADEHMYENGEYKFKPEKLGWAHGCCQKNCRRALENNVNLVIVSNTSTRESDVNIYFEMGEKYGYTIFTLVIENRNGTKNEHSVPLETLYRQEKQLKNSLKLV